MNKEAALKEIAAAALTEGRWASLDEADLSDANLYGASLSGADLTGAILARANLRSADLAGADLTVANLSGADLTGANLSGANFYGANLSGASLPEANLTKANLTKANLGGAVLSRANLTGCRSPQDTIEYPLVCRLAKAGACTPALLWVWEFRPDAPLRSIWDGARSDWQAWAGPTYADFARRFGD